MPRGLSRLIAVLLLTPCFLAVYDGVILVTSWQRLQRTAAALGRSVAQADALHETDFGRYFDYAAAQAEPDDVVRDGAVIVTAIVRDGGGTAIPWQRRIGSALVASRFGAPGGVVPQFNGSWLGPGPAPQRLIATELVAPLSPWVIGAGWLSRLIAPTLHAAALQRSALPMAALPSAE